MNKPLDSCPRSTKEAIESARMTTTSSILKNQLRPTRKIEMIPKSGGPSY
jgi:hypothetical protein